MSDGAEALLDLRPVKRAVERLFPGGHPAREAIHQEPDALPRAEGVTRLGVYVRVLFALRKGAPGIGRRG